MATSQLIATTKAVTLFRVVTGDIEIAESQRSNSGGTAEDRGLYWNTEARRHGEYIFKFSEGTESFFRTPWLCPAFPSVSHFPLSRLSLSPVLFLSPVWLTSGRGAG